MNTNEAIDMVNDLLSISAAITVTGKEVKCWCPDEQDGGVSKTYLSEQACIQLSLAFATLAEAMRDA